MRALLHAPAEQSRIRLHSLPTPNSMRGPGCLGNPVLHLEKISSGREGEAQPSKHKYIMHFISSHSFHVICSPRVAPRKAAPPACKHERTNGPEQRRRHVRPSSTSFLELKRNALRATATRGSLVLGVVPRGTERSESAVRCVILQGTQVCFRGSPAAFHSRVPFLC